MRNPEDGMKDFQKRDAPYRHVNLLGSEGKRKREKSEVNEDLPVRIHSSNQDSESAPIMTAWAVPSAGGKRRRKRRNRRIRDRLGIRSNLGNNQTAMLVPSLPRFKIGETVKYLDDQMVNCEGNGTITAVIQPGIEGYSPDDGEFRYEIDTIYVANQGASGWILEDELTLMKRETILMVTESEETTEALHLLDHIGIDTCSAMSVSTEFEDFLFVDKSEEAIRSVALNGVGGGSSEVGGRGPLLVKTNDSEGNEVFIVDPAGVYLKSSISQARLRIFGQQRLKSFGVFLQQNKFVMGRITSSFGIKECSRRQQRKEYLC
jgi:hypothetical protein